ncbi:MAG: hypothetical protein AAGC74_02130 [Verrucomicrobiota bacterium]
MNPIPLLPIPLLLATSLSSLSQITPLTITSDAELQATVATDDGSLYQNSDFVVSPTNASSIENLVVNDGTEDLMRIDGYVSGRSLVVRNEGNYLHYVASVTADLAARQLKPETVDTTTMEFSGGAGFSFEITGSPVSVVLDFDFSNFANVSATLSQQGPLGNIYVYPNDQDLRSFSTILNPGIYSFGCGGTTVDPIVTSSAKAKLAVSLSVGTEPQSIPLPPVGNYTHPDITTSLSGEGILQVENPQILSEVDLGNGFTQLEVTASVRNLYSCPWPEVNLTLTEQPTGGPNLEILTNLPSFSLAPNQLGTPPLGSVLLVQVPTPDAPTLRSQILDTSRFQTSGIEQPVFNYPIRPLTPEDLEVPPTETPPTLGLLFDYVPLFESGTTIIEWEDYYQLPRLVVIEDQGPINEDLISWLQNIDRDLPILVADIVRVGTEFRVLTHEDDFTLPEVMKDGSLTTTLTPEGHPENWGVTNVPETRQTTSNLGLTGFFPASIPFHFNQIELPGGILFSGSFGFRPELVEVELDMRNASIRNLITRARWRADCNLLLETSEEADNIMEPIAGQETTLLDLPLFSLQLPAGFSFEPRLELTAGAILNAPTSLSLPITGGFLADISAGIRDGSPFTDGDITTIPLQVSDPGIYEALGITASSWLDCEVKALIGIGQGFANTGPTLGARAQADFALLPLADPWWSTDATLSAFAGVEFDLIGLIQIIDAEQTIASRSFFNLSADGPLNPPGPTTFSIDPQPAFLPLADPETRWARSLLPTSSGVNGQAFATQLPLSGDIITGQGDAFTGTLAKLSPEGELLWTIDPTTQMPPVSAIALPDDSFTLLGSNRSNFRIANFDDAGNLLWHQSIFPAAGGPILFKTSNFLRRETTTGTTEYVLLGQALGGSLTGFHPILVKTDATGNPLWAKVYHLQPLATESTTSNPGALCLTADGDILIAADTVADLPAGVNPLANITTNGQILKIDGDTGQPLWSTLVASIPTLTYHAISEGPDGAIYVGGQATPNVLSELPSMILTKLNPDGTLIDSALIGTAPGQNLPNGGTTVFDTIRSMAWFDDNLWICGQAGIFNAANVGGVGNGASAFTAMVSPNLDVSRFTLHAAPSTDSFHTIEASNKGLLISGYSTSFHPWPIGAGSEGTGTPGSLLTLRLPWEGRLLFHPSSAGRQFAPNSSFTPDRGSYYAYPRVITTSQYAFSTNQSLFAGLGQINITENSSSSPTVLVTDVTMSTSSFVLTPVFTQPSEFINIQFMPESLITDFNSFLEFHQIDSDSDGDGDGIDAPREYFHGTSPYLPDNPLIDFAYLIDEFTEEPFVRFTMPRSHLVGTSLPTVFSSPDLDILNFLPRSDLTTNTIPLDNNRDTLSIDLPADEVKQFFQLEFPN